MDKYELHVEATVLMDTTSHYELARKYLMLAECYGESLKLHEETYQRNKKLTEIFNELKTLVG